MTDKGAEKWAVNEARKIIRRVLKNHRVRAWLFGSRANGKAGRFSDIDIALDGYGRPVPNKIITDLHDSIEKSFIPFKVEIVDILKLGRRVKEKIGREGQLWAG